MSSFDDNLAKRMRQTMGSELEPELVTPETAGSEEFPDGLECLPIENKFKQTNMRGGRITRRGSTSGRGRDQD